MPGITSRARTIDGAADRRLGALLRAAALLCVLVLAAIVLLLAYRTLPILAGFGGDLLDPRVAWQPGAQQFGMLPMVAGSLAVTVLAMAIAVPVSVLAAAWLRLFARERARRLLRAPVELLAGVPSVVYGLWGLLVLVPLINGYAPPGASWLAASLVLALMIAPLALLVSDAAFAQFPLEQHRAASALALSRWGIWRQLMLPQAAGAIGTGIMLQLGRALGETMAVLMVAGNVVQWPSSVLEPVRTLTANIALEMAYASGSHQSALFASGLLLTITTGLLVLPAHRWRRGESAQHD